MKAILQELEHAAIDAPVMESPSGVLDQDRLAPGIAVTGPEVPGVTALLQQFLDHAQGNPEAAGNLFAVAFLLVIGGHPNTNAVVSSSLRSSPKRNSL